MNQQDSEITESSSGPRKPSPKKLLKKPLLIVLFVLINVAVIAITAFSEFGNSENAVALSEVKINWWLLIPAALCFLIAIWFEIHKYTLMMREMSKGKAKFDKKHNFLVDKNFSYFFNKSLSISIIFLIKSSSNIWLHLCSIQDIL